MPLLIKTYLRSSLKNNKTIKTCSHLLNKFCIKKKKKSKKLRIISKQTTNKQISSLAWLENLFNNLNGE